MYQFSQIILFLQFFNFKNLFFTFIYHDYTPYSESNICGEEREWKEPSSSIQKVWLLDFLGIVSCHSYFLFLKGSTKT